MSKLKTIALAAGFTALSGNALARETPAESRDSVSTTTETVIQNQPERKTYAISDKTLRFRTSRDEVKNTWETFSTITPAEELTLTAKKD